VTIFHRRSRCQATLITELVIALGILAVVVLPMSFSFYAETRLTRVSYYRAVALEIVDGEMEVLRAGGWKSIAEGVHAFIPHGRSATNLPPGQFLLTRTPGAIRLEWRPAERHSGGGVVRETPLPK